MAGKLKNKKNTFNDFIACTRFLINNGCTTNHKLVIRGRRAGGTLIGAVLSKKQFFYKGAILQVPFVDVYNTMSDHTLPLTAGEWGEWGNPSTLSYKQYIKSYCPFQNISKQIYLSVYITGELYDARVSYWEPMKYAFKLRDNSISNNPLLLYINCGSHMGHTDIAIITAELVKRVSFN